MAFGRQAVVFGFVQINDQNDLCRRRLGFQKADKSRLDHALDRLRSRGHDLGILARQDHAIISYKGAANRHELE